MTVLPFTYILSFRFSPNRWVKSTQQTLTIDADSDFHCRDVQIIWVSDSRRMLWAVKRRIWFRSDPTLFGGKRNVKSGTSVQVFCENLTGRQFKIPTRKAGGFPVSVQLMFNGMKLYRNRLEKIA